MRTLLVVLSFLALANCDTPFKDCGSSQGTITKLDITDVTPCTAQPCILKKNTNATISQNFTAKAAITKATTKVYGYLGPVKMPFPLPDTNACDFISGGCPLKSGQAVSYKQSIEVKKEYPSTNVIVQWELHSDSGMITCFQVPATIQD